MNSPQYQCLCTCASNYFSSLQQSDGDKENIKVSPPHHPNITIHHGSTHLKALKALNYNHHRLLSMYLMNDFELWTWNNNPKQDMKLKPSSINDATSCMPSSPSKMLNIQPKTITSHWTTIPSGMNYHMLLSPSSRSTRHIHWNHPLQTLPRTSKEKAWPNIHQIFWTTHPSKPNPMLLDWPMHPHWRESRNQEQCTTMEGHSHQPH